MRLPDRNRISPGKKEPLQRVPGIFRHKLQGKRVRHSAVEFAGEGRDHFALLGLVGSQCLVGQGMSSYKSQKSARRAALMSQLYG